MATKCWITVVSLVHYGSLIFVSGKFRA